MSGGREYRVVGVRVVECFTFSPFSLLLKLQSQVAYTKLVSLASSNQSHADEQITGSGLDSTEVVARGLLADGFDFGGRGLGGRHGR